MEKKYIIKKFIYDDFDIIKKKLDLKLKKIETKKDFYNFVCYFFSFMIENINNFNKENNKFDRLEVDIISMKKISAILKYEMIGFEFENYPTILSKTIKSLNFSKNKEEYIVNFLYKIQEEVYKFYGYTSYYSEKKEKKDFYKIFNDIFEDFKKFFNFKCNIKTNQKDDFSNEFKTEIIKMVFLEEECQEEIKNIEKMSKNLSSKKDIISIIEKEKNFLESRFNKINEENNKNKNFSVEVTDQCLYYFHHKLNSIDSLMSDFLIMKKIKKLNISKDNIDKIRKIILVLKSVSFDLAAFARERRLWNKSEMEHNANIIKEIKKRFNILKENLNI